MNKIVNGIIWVVLLVLLLPSSLAIASWNSLPGSRLFATKLFMEQALVFLVPTTKAKGDLQIAYTERRFSEARRLIADKSSVQGLQYLDSQVGVTREQILNASDPTVKRQLARKYITTLQTVSTQLEEQKQIAISNVPTSTAARPTEPIFHTPTPTQAPAFTTQPVLTVTHAPTPTPTKHPTPTPTPSAQVTQNASDDVVGSINTSQQQINQTIQEMEDVSGDKDNNGNNGQNNGNGGNGNNGNNWNNGNSNGGSGQGNKP